MALMRKLTMTNKYSGVGYGCKIGLQIEQLLVGYFHSGYSLVHNAIDSIKTSPRICCSANNYLYL